MYDLKRISEEIEALGGMSAEDVLHVGKAIVRNMREKLTEGRTQQYQFRTGIRRQQDIGR